MKWTCFFVAITLTSIMVHRETGDAVTTAFAALALSNVLAFLDEK